MQPYDAEVVAYLARLGAGNHSCNLISGQQATVFARKAPLDGNRDNTYGVLTHEAHLVEAVVSVRDRGALVGDIDISAALVHPVVSFKTISCVANHQTMIPSEFSELDMKCLDSWDEVLDPPPPHCPTVIRCRGIS
ncbi:hypothetical protein CHU98_g8118 [Xylaria longipes]|nr:hypothetical protein CHU98_g8118 [Xylaria longipes]